MRTMYKTGAANVSDCSACAATQAPTVEMYLRTIVTADIDRMPVPTSLSPLH